MSYRSRYDKMPTTSVINEGSEDEIRITAYRKNQAKTVICYIGYVASLGLLALIFHWKPSWKLKSTSSLCSWKQADALFIKDIYKETSVVKVHTLAKTLSVRLNNKENQIMYKKKPNYFIHQKIKYIWSDEKMTFTMLKGLDDGVLCKEFYETYHLGLTENEQEQRLSLYGKNKMDISVIPLPILFFREIVNPFYIFQIFSVGLWIFESYYYFCFIIVGLSAVSIGISLYSTRKQQSTLHSMCISNSKVDVLRGNKIYQLAEELLVPGDIIQIPINGCILTCDAVLTSGQCVVNESMLTGESVPITKTPLPKEEQSEGSQYSPDKHKRHTLFCGTHIMQTREKARAVVIRTGFLTAKGALVRSILHPKLLDFKLYSDTRKFLFVLIILSLCGFTFSVVYLILIDSSVEWAIVKGLDVIVMVVPPTLPAALTIGTIFAQFRLEKGNIFCIAPSRINIASGVSLVCFDKTGTLTEDGLNLLGIVPIEQKRFLPNIIKDVKELAFSPIFNTMAVCHSLTKIDGEIKGDPLEMKMFEATNWILVEIHGDQESSIHKTVKTVVKGPKLTNFEDNLEIGIVHHFSFSSELQRMSVVTKTKKNECMELYSKGAPEMIASLCNIDSVPENLEEVLKSYTQKGLRVLALAWRKVDKGLQPEQIQHLSRQKFEKNLNFLGLLLMQNQLKLQTKKVLGILEKAQIQSVMVTGDNIQTAISVAKEAGMIRNNHRAVIVSASLPNSNEEGISFEIENEEYTSANVEYNEKNKANKENNKKKKHESRKIDENTSLNQKELVTYYDVENSVKIDLKDSVDKNEKKYHFAMDGKNFGILLNYYDRNILLKLLTRGTVFARMSPEQKAQLVELYQDLGYCVGACGDGANDCGALKTAHVGISLSKAEASAAAPFTSKEETIECVPRVIQEGRAALASSYGIFKTMVMYGMIILTCNVILYLNQSNLGEWQYIYIDVTTMFLVLFMGSNEVFPKLSIKRPRSGILEKTMMTSLVLYTMVQIVTQLGGYFYLLDQEWFMVVPKEKNSDVTFAHINTVLFYITLFQFFVSLFVFSKGKPYRKAVYTNVPFIIGLLLTTGTSLYILLFPAPSILNFFELKKLPMEFKLMLLMMILADFLASWIIEDLLKDSDFLEDVLNYAYYRGRERNQEKYKEILKELNSLEEHEMLSHLRFGSMDQI